MNEGDRLRRIAAERALEARQEAADLQRQAQVLLAKAEALERLWELPAASLDTAPPKA